MTQWYLSYEGTPHGPFDLAQAVAQVRKRPDGHAWREGFVQWLPISKIDELSPKPDSAPLPPPESKPQQADVIDFKIFGNEMQYVEVELDPGETVVAEAGAMNYMDQGISFEAKMGDGSEANEGMMGKLLGGDFFSITGKTGDDLMLLLVT